MEHVTIIGLLLCLAIALLKIAIDKKRIQIVNEQLSSIVVGHSRSIVKTYGSNRLQDELIGKINQLVLLCSETHANYLRIEQQNKQMTSSISHDFRTPLTSMLGYVQILEQHPNPELQTKYLKVIEARIKNLSMLIEDFYMLSIIDSNEYPLTIGKVNPKLILQEQLAMYYEELSAHFAHLVMNIDEVPVIVLSDAHALHRIFSNLIRNALMHGVESFYVSFDQKEDGWEVLFQNQLAEPLGVDANLLFQRNYRNASTNNRVSTGLGLSIAKDLAQLIDCRLEVSCNDRYILFTLSITK